MKISNRLVALLLPLTPCLARAQETQPPIQPIPWSAPAGSEQLWNGSDLTGWTPFFSGTAPAPPGFWSATGGVLHLAGKPKGYFKTEKVFSNYHLHAEWRWLGQPKSGTNNSGIFVFQHPPDAVWPYSVQVQIKAGSTGDLISQGGLLFPPGQPNPTIKKIADANEKPPGEWNGDDIYCRGASVEVYVNGLRQNFVDKLPTDSGQIALQVEGYPVEFRNLWLQPLLAAASATQDSGTAAASVSQVSGTAAAAALSGTTPLEWSVRMANSEMKRLGKDLDAGSKADGWWDYTTGLYADALIRLSDASGDPAYEKNAEEIIGSFIGTSGTIATYEKKRAKPKPSPGKSSGKTSPAASASHSPAARASASPSATDDETPQPKIPYSLDDVQSGVATLKLYDITHEERYKLAADILREQLRKHPRIPEGGFWHKAIYPNQMWLDGLYMGEPFYAGYAARFKEPEDFADIARQFKLIGAHTYDPKTSLFYHGWDESKKQYWANPQTGTSPSFWSRAIGWYAMGLVDVLEIMPKDHPDRPALVDLLQKVAAGIVKYQDPATGVWWQVTDQGSRPHNYLESSASCMFVYALAKGVNEGLLPRSDIPAIRAGYQGLLRQFVTADPDGVTINLTRCCRVAGLDKKRDGSFDYYTQHEPIVSNDLKGVGPFITAGMECQKLLGADVFSPR